MTTDTELERLAKAATPGPWDFRAWSDYLYITKYLTDPPDISQSVNIARGIKQNNAAFIAAFNPAVALDLLTRLRAAERERDELREKCAISMGVGDGSGQLFVYGDYESIKAAQTLILKKAPSHDQP